jgi:hypothetical protein
VDLIMPQYILLILGAALLIPGVGSILLTRRLADRIVRRYEGASSWSAKDRAEAAIKMQESLLKSAAGGLLLLGALGTIGTLYGTMQSVSATRDGQVTDRYNKAIDQLNSDKRGVRLGAIYALERIALDSPRDACTITQVLTTFVRQPSSSFSAAAAPRGVADGSAEPTNAAEPDVNAALTVIARDAPRDAACPVDLSGADLRGARLGNAHLAGAILIGAELTGADLADADLKHANLHAANMQTATLTDAQLDGSDLRDAVVALEQLRAARLTPETRLPSSFRWDSGRGTVVPSSSKARMTVNPPTADEDGRFAVHGIGWPPGPVTLSLDQGEPSPRPVLVGKDGTFDYVVNAMHEFYPGAIPAGTHTVIARAQSGSLRVTASFTVRHDCAAQIVMTPSFGPVRTRVTIQGSCFQPGEPVVVRFHTTIIAEETASVSGSFVANGAVPRSSLAVGDGSFDVTAQGQRSFREAYAVFTVSAA